MSIRRLIESIGKLNKKLKDSDNKNNIAEPSLKKLNSSSKLKIKPFKLFIIGIPLMNSGKYSKKYRDYSRLSVKEKAEFILKGVKDCIQKIHNQYHLEQQDSVIIQLSEYALEGEHNKFLTIEERDEILKIFNKAFPINCNLTISLGGTSYVIPFVRGETYSDKKIERVKNNYEEIQSKYPTFAKKGAPLECEKKEMYNNLDQNTVSMILHNKNYVITNKDHLSHSKQSPFGECARYDYDLEEDKHPMVYNPGKVNNKNNFYL